jgi:hypothetical protein
MLRTVLLSTILLACSNMFASEDAGITDASVASDTEGVLKSDVKAVQCSSKNDSCKNYCNDQLAPDNIYPKDCRKYLDYLSAQIKAKEKESWTYLSRYHLNSEYADTLRICCNGPTVQERDGVSISESRYQALWSRVYATRHDQLNNALKYGYMSNDERAVAERTSAAIERSNLEKLLDENQNIWVGCCKEIENRRLADL